MKIINPVKTNRPNKNIAKPDKRALKPLKSIHNIAKKNQDSMNNYKPSLSGKTIENLVFNVDNTKWHLSQIPKVVYFYWGAKSMSFLRFMSIYSFKQLNPDWKIILYKPKTLVIDRKWEKKQFENKHDIPCYDEYVAKIAEVIEFDFETIGIGNDLNEVHKSDFIRYYLLNKYGGIWSDMDILYFQPMSAMFSNKPENSGQDSFVYIGTDKSINEILGHAIGFLMGSPGNIYFDSVFKMAKLQFKTGAYEEIGANLLNAHFNSDALALNYPNTGLLHKEEVYFLDHNKKEFIYDYDGADFFGKHSIGLHWYGGSSFVEKLTIEVNDSNYLSYPNGGTLLKLLRKLFPNGVKL